MNDQNDVAGYVSCRVMRAILKNEAMPVSKATFWRWLQRNRIPCKRAGNVLLVPGLLCLELMKRDKGLA